MPEKSQMQRHVLEDRLKLPNKLAKSSIFVTLQALKKNIPCRCRDGDIPAERWFEVCTNQGPKENNSQLTQVGESKMLRPKPCQTLYQFDHSIMRTLSFCFSTDLHLVKPSRLHAIVMSVAPCIGLQKGWLQQSQWSLRHLAGDKHEDRSS